MPHPVVSIVTESKSRKLYEFVADGNTCAFGRDPSCGIPIPDAGRRLSRIGGSIWRMDGELRLCNLLRGARPPAARGRSRTGGAYAVADGGATPRRAVHPRPTRRDPAKRLQAVRSPADPTMPRRSQQ